MALHQSIRGLTVHCYDRWSTQESQTPVLGQTPAPFGQSCPDPPDTETTERQMLDTVFLVGSSVSKDANNTKLSWNRAKYPPTTTWITTLREYLMVSLYNTQCALTAIYATYLPKICTKIQNFAKMCTRPKNTLAVPYPSKTNVHVLANDLTKQNSARIYSSVRLTRK